MGTTSSGFDTQTLTSNSTSSANLPGWAEDRLRKNTQIAGDLQDNNVGFGAYPGQTYIPMSAQELGGLQQIEDLAGSGNPFITGMVGGTNNLLNNMGVTGAQQGAMQPLQGIADGQSRINTGGAYGGIFDRLNTPTNSQINLGSVARGEQVGNSNPFLRDVIDQSADVIREQVGSTATGMGRYGSGTHQGVLGREVGDMASRAFANQMNIDLGRMDSANAQIDGAMNARAGTALGALGGQTQVQGANIANQAGAAGALGDMYGMGSDRFLQTAALSPTFNDARFGDAERTIGVGASYRGEMQNENQSFIDRWMQEQQAPWQRLGASNAIALGNSSPFRTETTTSTQQVPYQNNNPSVPQQIFGYGSAGLGLLGNLGVF